MIIAQLVTEPEGTRALPFQLLGPRRFGERLTLGLGNIEDGPDTEATDDVERLVVFRGLGGTRPLLVGHQDLQPLLSPFGLSAQLLPLLRGIESWGNAGQGADPQELCRGGGAGTLDARGAQPSRLRLGPVGLGMGLSAVHVAAREVLPDE